MENTYLQKAKLKHGEFEIEISIKNTSELNRHKEDKTQDKLLVHEIEIELQEDISKEEFNQLIAICNL